jgi:aspartate kinase
MEDIVVSEVRLDDDQARVTIANLPDVPGVAAEVFSAVAEGDAMVDMIVQNVSHSGHAHLSYTVPRTDLEQCLLLTRAVMDQWPEARLSHDRSIAKLSVMGIGLRSHTGVGERMFRALGDADINVQMINTSEIRMSAVIASEHGQRGLQCVLKAFGLQS